MIRQSGFGFVLALLLLSSLTGCNGGGSTGPTTYPVSGQVTLDGQPLPDGEIYFITADTGQVDIMPIENGRFEGQAVAGRRSVQIMAYREGPPQSPMPGEPPEPTKENYLPNRYHAETELEADIQPSDSNDLTFELTSN